MPAASPATLAAISFSPSTLTGGDIATGFIALAAPAPRGGVTINLSSNSAVVLVPAQVDVPEGQSGIAFTVTTALVGSTRSVTITATSANALGTSLTVNPQSSSLAALATVIATPSTVIGATRATGIVTLSAAAPSGGVEVNLASSNAAVIVPTGLILAAGQSSATFPIVTNSVASTRSAILTATSANSVSTLLTLNPPAAGPGKLASVSIAPSTLSGGSGALGTVTLAIPAPAGGISVNLSSSDAAAVVPGQLDVTAGQTSATFPIATNTVSAIRTITITAGSLNSVDASLTVNPTTAGLATLAGVSFSPASVTGGGGTTGTVSLAAPAPAGGVTVNLSTNKSFAGVAANVVVPAGQTSIPFAVTTDAVEATQTVVVKATSANSVNGSLSIGPPPASQAMLTAVSVSPGTVTGGGNSTGTVTLSVAAPAGGVAVSLSSNDTAASVPAQLDVAAGQTSATFLVSTGTALATRNIVITAASTNSVSTTLTVHPPAAGLGLLASVSVSPATVTGGSLATGTVTLVAAAPAGGVYVTLSRDNAAATVPASLTIPAGQTTATFSLVTSVVSSTREVSISAMSVNTVNTSLTLNPPAASQAMLSVVSVSPATVTGGSDTTGTVALAVAAPAGGVTVNLSTNHAAVTVPAQIDIAAGQTSAAFRVTTSAVTSPRTSPLPPCHLIRSTRRSP